MDPKRDAFGQALLACQQGKRAVEIIERDDGYISAGAMQMDLYFGDYSTWPDIERRAIKFAKGKVIDIGCGAGRVGLYLQKRGIKVTGVDKSPLAVKVCTMRGMRDARLIPVDKVGERFGKGAFDTVIMFGNNFGLFGSYKGAKRLLRDFYRITSGNAMIIAETMDPHDTKEAVHLAYDRRNRRMGRMWGQIRFRVRFGAYMGEWLDYLFVSKGEMKRLLGGTGWEVKKFINSGKASRYGSQYIAIIGKSK